MGIEPISLLLKLARIAGSLLMIISNINYILSKIITVPAGFEPAASRLQLVLKLIITVERSNQLSYGTLDQRTI